MILLLKCAVFRCGPNELAPPSGGIIELASSGSGVNEWDVFSGVTIKLAFSCGGTIRLVVFHNGSIESGSLQPWHYSVHTFYWLQ